MDFFQAQDNAIRKTKRLVFYYLVAVVLIVAAVYFAVTAGYVTYFHLTRPEGAPPVPFGMVPLWDAGRFLITTLVVVFLVGTGSLYKVLSLRDGGSAVAKSLGGELVDRSTRDLRRRQLLNVVEEMAIASGVPVPEVYILPRETSINAFAAGWGRDDAVIAVSAGALEQLSRDELQGVVAHEYSHVLHGDCRLNIRLMGVLFGIMMLTIFGSLMRMALYGGRRRGGHVIIAGGGRRGGGGSKGGGGALVIAVLLVIVLVTVIGYIGTFFGRLIQAAISRQREFLADAAAVQFTRNPDGIAGALKRIAVHSEQAVLQHPNATEAAHMFFADGMKRSLSSVLATHPPLRARIEEILPNWDGKLDPVQDRGSPPEEQKAAASPVRPDGRRMIEGMAILGAIGTMSRENLDTARQITSEIPEQLDARMREPDGARQAILALLIADNKKDDAAQLKLLEAECPEAECQAIREALEWIHRLPREARLGVLELATTTLAQSMDSGKKGLYNLMEKLIQADRDVSLYEFCVQRILKERLQRGSTAARNNAPVQYLKLDPEVAKAIGRLLSLTVQTTGGAGAPGERLAQSLQGLYLLQGKVDYHDIGDDWAESLDESLDVLRQSAYAIRAQVLRAVVSCIKEDGQLDPEEAEMLRMISLSLDCPLPPLDFSSSSKESLS